MTHGPDPSAETAAQVIQQVFGRAPGSVRRFTTGGQHFVYDVSMSDGTNVVVRLSRQSDMAVAKGALYWSEHLKDLALPLPKVLAADFSCTRCPFPFAVLERLAGQDLGQVYDDMPDTARQTLAMQLAGLQAVVTALPSGAGYGFVASLEAPFPHANWRGVLDAEITRSHRRIRQADVVSPSYAVRTLDLCDQFKDYLDQVAATPFLHDITTKNVIIHENVLSGIVDVDELCFGDPMYLPALINIALRAHRKNPAYVEEFLLACNASATDRQAVRLYSVVHCLGFLGELGTRFNHRVAEPVNPVYKRHLESLFEDLVASI